MIAARACAVVAGFGPLVSAWALPFWALEAVVERSETPDDAPLARIADAVLRRFGASFHARVVEAPPAALGAHAAVAVAALRLAGVDARQRDLLSDLCSTISEVVGHADAESVGASLLGAPVVCAAQHPPAVFVLRTPSPLWLTVALGAWPFDRDAWRRAMPANIATGRLLDTLRRAAALAPAWERGDTGALGALLEDRLFAPAIGAQIPGFFPTLRAAREAGAFAAAMAGGGGALCALSVDEATAGRVAAAMRATLDAHSNTTFVETCRLGGLHDGP
jgi:homoserine kinase